MGFSVPTVGRWATGDAGFRGLEIRTAGHVIRFVRGKEVRDGNDKASSYVDWTSPIQLRYPRGVVLTGNWYTWTVDGTR